VDTAGRPGYEVEVVGLAVKLCRRIRRFNLTQLWQAAETLKRDLSNRLKIIPPTQLVDCSYPAYTEETAATRPESHQ
jgi:hypothetical protein